MTDERHEKALEAAEWIEHEGGICPVAPDTVVDFKRRCDTEPDAIWRPEEFRAADLRWTHLGKNSDIIAYRVVPNHFTNGE